MYKQPRTLYTPVRRRYISGSGNCRALPRELWAQRWEHHAAAPGPPAEPQCGGGLPVGRLCAARLQRDVERLPGTAPREPLGPKTEPRPQTCGRTSAASAARAEGLGRPARIRPQLLRVRLPAADRGGPGREAVAAERRAARNGRGCGGGRHGAGGGHGRERLREVGTGRRGEGLRCDRRGAGGRERPRLGQAQPIPRSRPQPLHRGTSGEGKRSGLVLRSVGL